MLVLFSFLCNLNDNLAIEPCMYVCMYIYIEVYL